MNKTCRFLVGAMTLTAAFITATASQAESADFAQEGLIGQEGLTLDQALAGLPEARKATIEGVDCNNGGSLAEAVKSPRRILIIWFAGTCVEEEIRIARDDVTIRGIGDNATIVGMVQVDASLRVKLKNFTVRDPVEAGIDIQRGSSVRVENVDVVDSPLRGILIEESSVELANVASVTTRDGSVGVLNRASNVTVEGTLEASGYLVAGISATLGARYFINGAELNLHDNAGSGAIFQINAGVTFSNGRITANNNGQSGLLLASGAALLHGDVEVEANGNGLVGIFVIENSSWAPFVGFSANIIANGNAFAGAVAQDTSAFTVRGGTQEFRDNGNFGVAAANLGRLALSGASTLSGNGGANLFLVTSSLATIGGGNTIEAPVVCDSSANVSGIECNVVIDAAVTGPSARQLAPGAFDQLRVRALSGAGRM